MFDIICAVDNNYGFGFNNNSKFTLPWKNDADMKYFKNKTIYTENPLKKNAIVMGKNTWLSINKILPNRVNIVLTKEDLSIDNLITIKNFDDVFNIKDIENIYVIGGCKLIHSLLEHPKLRYIYLNKINENYDCNIFLKPLLELEQFTEESKIDFSNVTNYKIKNNLYNDEYNYLNLLKSIFKFGNKRNTRNSITLSNFGKALEFNLLNRLPIITTKKIFIRGIIEELLWFLKGNTNSKILENKNINIWKGNTNLDFLRSMNLDYDEGDIGEMYGFNWLHFGVDYEGYNKDYNNLGFNQIEYCLNLLDKDPFSRRILMTTFNPSTAHKGVLYPCHGIVTQFYVEEIENIRYLYCNMYQRSADMFLGVPFNITSYSLLCYIFSEILTNKTKFIYKPKNLKIYVGDCHIYQEHIEAVHKQVERTPFKFPKIEFNKKIINTNELNYEDFKIIDYKCNDTIKAPMIS